MARVLVVDDEADIRQLVSYALAEDGHDVSIAEDGSEAIALLDLGPHFELLVLDVMMPDVDGYRVLRELEERGLRDTTKILMLTARGSEQDFKHAYDLGAHQYMTKPFDPDDLIVTVRDLLAATPEELAARREEEQDRSNLLAQLESIFGETP